ncbi:Nuclear intron maturase 3 protein [Thalictrum thalictroides]|uniref:Nuclear intron maturase 3 protein n=1 Tax=Thalictrum thalictroides TaxID=46969 RepID=A0A7J6WBU3_THATH|nr:Nuclear intron maturase 3 protein [Thalictrum thalictroides]
MVLEVVYDKRFATFAYGGRVGMGRHTAIRYLKSTVENPTWWFAVRFLPHVFECKHFSKLSSIVEEKIEDTLLICMLKRLFESDAVRVELGSCFMGRGLPQESSLSAILVNIYFSGFDKQIQDLRIKLDKMNPRFDTEEISGRVFHKPVKMFAVRYLDDIIIITSGSKLLTLDLKNEVVRFLEEVMELKVDKVETAIHSAVSEKIDFLGMELRAVTPSFLHPALSEKAMRARQKYTKMKEGQALERKNARETNRKKLGLKILNHVYKKLKRSEGFKIEFQIEKEVRDIFQSWANDVVKDFFASLEERYNWHRKLSSGDFLSLRAIRNQLPPELVEAYDQFQEQVDKHLTPINARNVLDEEERQKEEAERQSYADRTVKDLTKLCMRVAAPEDLIKKAVKLAGFTNSMGRPRPIELLFPLEDTDIIKWYAGVGRRWLDFFCCCRNFKMVKTVVTYHLRFSCILTLAEKHSSTKREAIRHYTKDLKVFDTNGVEEVNFPTEREIKMMGDKDFSDPKPVDGALSMALIRLASNEPSSSCMAYFCDRLDTVTYRIHLLQSRLKINPYNKEKWVPGMGVIHESLHRKCVSLCPDHISNLYLGKISLQDIDCTTFVDVI